MFIRALMQQDIDPIIDFSLGASESAWSKNALQEVLKASLEGRYLVKVGLDKTAGTVIGYAVASHTFDQADVQQIVVDHGFRGQSWGRKLLQMLIIDLTDRGVETVFLEVRPSNQVAVNLYHSMGFECIQKRRDYYPGVDGAREDALVFSLKCR